MSEFFKKISRKIHRIPEALLLIDNEYELENEIRELKKKTKMVVTINED